MTDQAYALTSLFLAAGACAAALGFGLGRLTGRTRGRAVREVRSEAVLASALEDGLARLKAQQKVMSDRAVASERLNSQIVASLTAGLLLVDGRGHVELLNPAGRRFLGLAYDVTGVDFTVALSSAPALVSLIEECRRSLEAIVRRTLTIAGPQGTLHLGVTVSPVDQGERSGGVICLFSDLTSVVEMEDQLRLKDALARLGELTAGLAHEFRNGLATIHGYGRLLDPDELPAPYRPYVVELRRETAQLGQVVTNFLKFAKPEPMSFAPVSLEAVARRSAEELRHDLVPGTTITVEGGFADIDGDELLLKQAFDNLYRNAAFACADGGVAPAITVRGEVDWAHRTCRVLVDDNGPGIPQAERERVFRPFFTTRAGGTGLGLAIVQKIVLAHNGKITVADSPAGGARLSLVFPVGVPLPVAVAVR